MPARSTYTSRSPTGSSIRNFVTSRGVINGYSDCRGPISESYLLKIAQRSPGSARDKCRSSSSGIRESHVPAWLLIKDEFRTRDTTNGGANGRISGVAMVL